MGNRGEVNTMGPKYCGQEASLVIIIGAELLPWANAACHVRWRAF